MIAAVFLFDLSLSRRLDPGHLGSSFFAYLILGFLISACVTAKAGNGAAGMLIVMAIGFPSVLYFCRSWPEPAGRFGPRQVALMALVMPPVALLLWSAANIGIVAWTAAKVANSRPFCLQVPRDYLGRNTEVTSFSQLSGLRMQVMLTNGGSSDFQFAFHAVLVVEDGRRPLLYNWSYRAQAFLPVSETAQRMAAVQVQCKPRNNFLSTL